MKTVKCFVRVIESHSLESFTSAIWIVLGVDFLVKSQSLAQTLLAVVFMAVGFSRFAVDARTAFKRSKAEPFTPEVKENGS